MNVGDVVILKSGGPDMTLVERSDRIWKCLYWWPGTGDFRFGMFPEESLTKTKARPGKKTRKGL